ncbi:ATPase [Macleaya cordata]|uniref:ATPase n=1 Tax=Macleaya cordata TaxID=56857 RepID=A0A200QT93_MACCD|nr:ATPase [Macleaya cordata]
MNDAEVSKQIQQMVRFILQEAEEKANEISVSAEEEFNIEKLQLVEAEKKKIRQEYERKAKQVEVRKKIEYSMQLNASRIKVLQAQDDLVNSMKDSASQQLLHVSDDKNAYSKLLKDLIVQSLLRLKEPSVLLRCREVDRGLVQSILEKATQEYAEKAKVHPPKVTVDDRVYLPPPPSGKESHGTFCSGGVVLASQDGKIVFENTLDARLDVVFRMKLPEGCSKVSAPITEAEIEQSSKNWAREGWRLIPLLPMEIERPNTSFDGENDDPLDPKAPLWESRSWMGQTISIFWLFQSRRSSNRV